MSHAPEHADLSGSRPDPPRITLRPAGGSVRVRIAELVVAESSRATLLLERGFPPRWYLPRQDVRLDLLRRSSTTTICPFKGQATYWSCDPAGPAGRDVAWSYEDPVAPMAPIKGLICFWDERTTTSVDPEAAEPLTP